MILYGESQEKGAKSACIKYIRFHTKMKDLGNYECVGQIEMEDPWVCLMKCMLYNYLL